MSTVCLGTWSSPLIILWKRQRLWCRRRSANGSQFRSLSSAVTEKNALSATGPACIPALYYLKPITLFLDSCAPYCPTVLHSGAGQGNIRKLAKLVRGHPPPPTKIATEKCQALVGFRCRLRDMRLPLRWPGPIIIWKCDTKKLCTVSHPMSASIGLSAASANYSGNSLNF